MCHYSVIELKGFLSFRELKLLEYNKMLYKSYLLAPSELSKITKIKQILEDEISYLSDLIYYMEVFKVKLHTKDVFILNPYLPYEYVRLDGWKIFKK